MLFVAILAGGPGTRLWPLSSAAVPKPLLALGGARTLLQAAADRAARLAGMEHLLVVSQAPLAAAIRRQLPDLPAANLLLEPQSRDTAAAVGLAAAEAERRCPGTLLAVLPADHHVGDETAYVAAVRTATTAATERNLILVGLRPTRAETGYGYVELAAAEPGDLPVGVFAVRRFVEKPGPEQAAAMVASGQFLWNMGVVVGRAARVLAEIRRCLPDLGEGLTVAAHTPLDEPTLEHLYARAPRLSFDRAVLEKSLHLGVVAATFPWDDLGNWNAVHRVHVPDAAGNVCQGQVRLRDARDCLVFDTCGTTAVLGVSGLVIVRTPDGLLVCDRARAHEAGLAAVGSTAAAIPAATAPHVQVVPKPWGREVWWAHTPAYVGKFLEVRAGHTLSLQYHREKLETLYCLQGTGILHLNGQDQDFTSGCSMTITPGTVHRLKAMTELTVVEVSTPQVEDVVRLADAYGRTD